MKLYVATPMYDGTGHGIYMKSCLALQEKAIKKGISIQFAYLYRDALVARARNYLVEDFLKSDCTHLIFIDSDVGFQADDILSAIALNLDFVGFAFPKKTLSWDIAKRAIMENPNIKSSELELLMADFAYNSQIKNISLHAPVEVDEVGTGLVILRRRVFDIIKERLPNNTFSSDQTSAPSSKMYCFFDTSICPKTNRYLSESFYFCDLWKRAGGKIFVYQKAKVNHAGLHIFKGDISAISKYTYTLK